MISFASDLQIFWPKAKWISALSLEAERASVSAGSVRTFIAGMLGCHCGFGLICWESFYVFDSVSCFEPVVRFYWITLFLRTERILFLSQLLKVPTLPCLHFPSICVPLSDIGKFDSREKFSNGERGAKMLTWGIFHFSFVCSSHLISW